MAADSPAREARRDAILAIDIGGSHIACALVRGGVVLPWDSTDRMAARLARSGGSSRDPVLQALQYRDLGPWLAMLALPSLLTMLRKQE